MKRGEQIQKNVSRPSNPPDQLAQNVSIKSLSDELFLHFSSKVRNLTVFSNIYMIRIRFFGSGELIQKGFSAARYSALLKKEEAAQRQGIDGQLVDFIEKVGPSKNGLLVSGRGCDDVGS